LPRKRKGEKRQKKKNYTSIFLSRCGAVAVTGVLQLGLPLDPGRLPASSVMLSVSYVLESLDRLPFRPLPIKWNGDRCAG